MTEAETASYPVEVTNCGRTLRFEQTPTRIVSGWPTSAELLIELGAQHKQEKAEQRHRQDDGG